MMSGGRSAAPGSLQPIRATVPYQLNRAPALLGREVTTADRTSARPPKPIRRTLSLDAIVAPYLQGHWPKEAAEAPAVTCVNDKATQTPSSWTEEGRGRRSSGGHKRSASWGSAEHLREVAKLRNQLQKRSRHAAPPAGCAPLPAGHAAGVTQTMPLNRLAPRLRRSVEGLNLELEEAFVCEKPDEDHEVSQLLDIPDGHRAPVPAQRCSSGSQSDASPGPLDLSLLSPSQSPCPLDPSLLSPPNSPCPLDPRLLSPSQSPSLFPCPMGEPELLTREPLCGSPSFALDPPLMRPCSSSPRPSQTCSFQRQPPEGCERIRVCEEAMSACQTRDEEPLLLQPSCPDPNKVNFTPHGGSAFCPVSLLKPLLPSMDLLFRGLSVSPVTGCPGQASPTRHLGMQ